jgi:hypothetical protein
VAATFLDRSLRTFGNNDPSFYLLIRNLWSHVLEDGQPRHQARRQRPAAWIIGENSRTAPPGSQSTVRPGAISRCIMFDDLIKSSIRTLARNSIPLNSVTRVAGAALSGNDRGKARRRKLRTTGLGRGGGFGCSGVIFLGLLRSPSRQGASCGTSPGPSRGRSSIGRSEQLRNKAGAFIPILTLPKFPDWCTFETLESATALTVVVTRKRTRAGVRAPAGAVLQHQTAPDIRDRHAIASRSWRVEGLSWQRFQPDGRRL